MIQNIKPGQVLKTDCPFRGNLVLNSTQVLVGKGLGQHPGRAMRRCASMGLAHLYGAKILKGYRVKTLQKI